MSVNPKTGCAQPTRDKGTTAEGCNDAYTGNISSTKLCSGGSCVAGHKNKEERRTGE